jgi:hypothetical protein
VPINIPFRYFVWVEGRKVRRESAAVVGLSIEKDFRSFFGENYAELLR